MADVHEQLFNILMDEDEITWQSLICKLVKESDMDPWDIDVSLLAYRYIEMVKKLNQFNFRLSGKIVLAAALLLRIKSTYLLTKDIMEFDRMIADTESTEEFYAGIEDEFSSPSGAIQVAPPELVPHTPQPKKRKVSLDDLMLALRKALEVQERRVLRQIKPAVEIQLQKRRDITLIIKEIYERIKSHFKVKRNKNLTFSQLVNSDSKKDKVRTFVPLLHLAAPPYARIDLLQEVPFGEIEIVLNQ